MIAEDLKSFRIERGLSQRQMAEALGVPLGTIRDWEQGRSRTHDNLLMLALAELDRRIAPPGMPMPPEAD